VAVSVVLLPLPRSSSRLSSAHLLILFGFFLLIRPRALRSTLFPYTTLFRSRLIPLHHRFHGRIFWRPRSTLILANRSCRQELKRSEEHTSELQSRRDLVCRLLLEKKKYRENAMRRESV